MRARMARLRMEGWRVHSAMADLVLVQEGLVLVALAQ